MDHASTDKVEHLVKNRQSVVARVGQRGGWADTLPQAIPSVFHDAQRTQRQTWNRQTRRIEAGIVFSDIISQHLLQC